MKNKDNPLGGLVFLSGSGCLLPFLIIFNLLFGWIFLKPLHWLITEAILILVFIINGYIMTRKITSVSSKRHGNVIDVEGEIIEERQKLK